MKKVFSILLLSVMTTLGILYFGSSSIAQKNENPKPIKSGGVPALKLSDPLPANLFVELARVINPAVVNISTKTMPRQMGRFQRDPFFDMLEQMYGLRGMPSQPRPQQALGTGFIIREDGLIVTNNHVIAGADKIDVQLSEGSEKLYEATMVGSDDRTDIALIKIKGSGFPTVNLGSSTETQVGEWVAAFGNPYGQGHTMTKGIVSAKGRALAEINRFRLIQTDAPINPGNSGGPLVNSKGQVIGVNAAIDPRAQNIGFAIPIDEVKPLIPQLEKTGKIKKGYLGVELGDLDPRSAMALGLKETEGAFVGRVDKSSPAGKAGMQPYDVIIEFNGKKVTNSAELRDMVADANIGGTVEAKVIREGRTKNLSIQIVERPEGASPRKMPGEVRQYSGETAPFELGFKVANMNEKLRKDFEIEEDVKKPVVVEINNQSAAASAGLMLGDVILDVNRKEISTASEAIKNLKKGTNLLRILRPGRNSAVLFITLEAQ